MKKVMYIVLAMLVIASVAMAQPYNSPKAPSAPVPNPNLTGAAPTGWTAGAYTQGTGIPLVVDKLGPHQNGGRGCAGCHAPHSGVRGNGGTMKWDSVAKTFTSEAAVGNVGNETLWGQDLDALVSGYASGINTGNGTAYNVKFDAATVAAHPSYESGIMMCLSCHDGNVATGAMMTNQALEPSLAGFPTANYGGQPIPTLLGNDGGTAGNYNNDHPIGAAANLGALGTSVTPYFSLNPNGTNVQLSATAPDSAYATFVANYTNNVSMGSRAGTGFAVDPGASDVKTAYVVCITCHTPHSMYVFSGTAAGVKGTYPTFFFLNGPYNPGADTAGGYKASSATQFCRSCHFKGAGGSNEGSGISIPTAF